MATNITVDESVTVVNVDGSTSVSSGSTIVTIANEQGAQGPTGATGPVSTTPGPTGAGVPVGGTIGQVLAKTSATDYATNWSTPNAGTVTSITTSSPLTGGTITSSGPIGIDQTALAISGTQITSGTINSACIPTLNQNTTGNAATATALATTRTINGVSFNGTADITVTDTTKAPLTGATFTGAITATDISDSTMTTAGVVTNSSAGLLQSNASLSTALGGTGQIYGSALVGRATLSADRTKASTSNTPEDVFWNAGATAVQYFNLDPDTLYSFDGYVQVTKDATSALPRALLTYYSTSTTALTPQAIACEITTRANTAVIGLIDLTSANTAANSNGSATTLTTFHYNFSGFIRTHATTAGRFNLALGLSATSTSAPVYKAGSTISLYKHGTGNSVNFGNWTA